MHFEWSMRALHAGKHVLVEKPMTSTAEEARQIFALAEKKGLVVLEAMHNMFVLFLSSLPVSRELTLVIGGSQLSPCDAEGARDRPERRAG